MMILDLRTGNSGKVPDKRRNKSTSSSGAANEPYSLYSLQESFWVDGLPGDPQLQNPQRKVVVVGLVPGNRPKPSSMTKYSQKPRT
jgi:hypothetical protein